MTDAQILKKVLEKAGMIAYHMPISKLVEHQFYFGVIFSHDFAKAFWKEEAYLGKGQVYEKELNWQYHLQQMVIEKEPLKYLEKFL